MNVFDRYVGTNLEEELPTLATPPVRNERVAILYANGNAYSYFRDDVDDLERIVTETDGADDIWDAVIEYAHSSTRSPSS